MASNWGQYPINERTLSNSSFISLLSIYIFPEVGIISFDRHLKVVVFPAPFTPKKPKHSPYSKHNDISLTAFVDLKHESNILNPNGPP